MRRDSLFHYLRQHGVRIKVARIFNTYGRLMDTEDAFTGPVNIGTPDQITVRELADLIVAMTDSPSRIVYRPLPQDDPFQRCPDISLARQALAWEPHVPLETGLQKTIAYFEELLRSS